MMSYAEVQIDGQRWHTLNSITVKLAKLWRLQIFNIWKVYCVAKKKPIRYTMPKLQTVFLITFVVSGFLCFCIWLATEQ